MYKELSSIFTDKFVHVGGDEVPSACWASNPSIQKYMKANNLTSFADLETLFEQRLLDLLNKQGPNHMNVGVVVVSAVPAVSDAFGTLAFST